MSICKQQVRMTLTQNRLTAQACLAPTLLFTNVVFSTSSSAENQSIYVAKAELLLC